MPCPIIYMVDTIICPVCRTTYRRSPVRVRCSCGGNLEYIQGKRRRTVAGPFRHARYLDFFPVKRLVTLDEGGTPLVRGANLERLLKLPFTLFFKNEFQNPTGSFKDRGSAVEIAKALEVGAKEVVVASTGNMGASVAAYAGLAGLKCTVLLPELASKTKLWQIISYGARVIRTKGEYADAAERAESMASKKRFLCGDYLYRREGTKSVGFEIAEQQDAEYVVCPIGNGNLISAIWKAFTEFRSLKKTKRPRLIGVQAQGCDPVVKGMVTGKVTPITHPDTIASAIECGDPLDGWKALRALQESRGWGVPVSDPSLLKARDLLARHEGIFAEPAGAAPLAGLLKAKKQIPRGSRVVLIIGGHGLKDPRWARTKV